MRNLALSRNALLCLSLSVGLLSSGIAQDDDAPPPVKSGVQITFVPPPLEGTLSLGIFDKAGKLVRSLHREATEAEFTVGLNGFVTRWDGLDDAGKLAPAGSYTARGYAVGDVEVEGVALHGNDWITDEESPRIRRITGLAFLQATEASGKSQPSCQLAAETVDGRQITVQLAADGSVLGQAAADESAALTKDLKPGVTIRDGRVFVKQDPSAVEFEVPGVNAAVYAFRLFPETPDARPKVNAGSLWIIEKTVAGSEVKQFLTTGEFRRRLKVDPSEPQPIAISSSMDANRVLLLEEGPGEQRVRLLAMEAVEPNQGDGPEAPPVQSTWKTVFSRSILTSDDFASVATKLKRAHPFKPEAKYTARLLPNPLMKDASTTVDLQVAIDESGAYLRTTDGLPLSALTEAPALKWAVIGREGSGKLLTLLESDGAVIEEFRVRKLANMMAFDAGIYEWTGRK